MPMMMLILDGLTDDPVDFLGSKTPFQAADCKHLLRMKQYGAYGKFLTVPQGFEVDSLTCIATLLGVPSQTLPTGRAYLEAVSAGIALTEEDAVCRCNLVSVDAQGILQSSCAANLSDMQKNQLYKRVTHENFKFYPIGGYKNLLVLKNSAGQINKICTYPPHQHLGEPISKLLPQGNALAQRLSEFALQNCWKDENSAHTHMLLPWDVTVKQNLPSFAELHNLSGAAVCATEIVRGIALAMGLTVVTPQGATADADTDLTAKVRTALTLAHKYDFIMVHVNGTDELSHRCDAVGKAAFLHRIDAELVAPLIEQAPQDTTFLVCSDHSTISATGRHRADPQPFVLYNNSKQQHANLGTRNALQAISLLKGLI